VMLSVKHFYPEDGRAVIAKRWYYSPCYTASQSEIFDRYEL
jgi:hypothetical protein